MVLFSKYSFSISKGRASFKYSVYLPEIGCACFLSCFWRGDAKSAWTFVIWALAIFFQWHTLSFLQLPKEAIRKDPGSLKYCAICSFNVHKIVAVLPDSNYLSYLNFIRGRLKNQGEGKRHKIWKCKTAIFHGVQLSRKSKYLKGRSTF